MRRPELLAYIGQYIEQYIPHKLLCDYVAASYAGSPKSMCKARLRISIEIKQGFVVAKCAGGKPIGYKLTQKGVALVKAATTAR